MARLKKRWTGNWRARTRVMNHHRNPEPYVYDWATIFCPEGVVAAHWETPKNGDAWVWLSTVIDGREITESLGRSKPFTRRGVVLIARRWLQERVA